MVSSVAQVELHQLQNSLLEAMERMFNERLPAAGGRGPHHEESGDENFGFGNGFHDVSAMLMVVVVVDDVLIFMISVEEDMDVIIMCILMMKIQVLRIYFMM